MKNTRDLRSIRVRIVVHVDEVSIFLVVEKKFLYYNVRPGGLGQRNKEIYISNAGRAPTYAIRPTFDA